MTTLPFRHSQSALPFPSPPNHILPPTLLFRSILLDSASSYSAYHILQHHITIFYSAILFYTLPSHICCRFISSLLYPLLNGVI